jgi:hypothetical protein
MLRSSPLVRRCLGSAVRPAFFRVAVASSSFALSSSSVAFAINAPRAVAAVRRFGGEGDTGFMKGSEMVICDLTDAAADGELVAAEINRRLRRAERLAKAAPYIGGAFLRQFVEESRTQSTEVEDALARFGAALPPAFVETARERIKKNRGECMQVLYDADLL